MIVSPLEPRRAGNVAHLSNTKFPSRNKPLTTFFPLWYGVGDLGGDPEGQLHADEGKDGIAWAIGNDMQHKG